MSSKSDSSRDRVIAALAKLSQTSIISLTRFYTDWLKAGRSSLITSYASNIATADFLHSAGLLTDGAYNNISQLSTLTDFATVGASLWSSLFGNAALQPVLKSLVEQEEGGDSETDDAKRGANTEAIAGAIKLAMSAAEIAA